MSGRPLEAGAEALVLGLGHYGRSVSRALRERGVGVVVIEDRPADDTAAFAAEWDLRLVEAPGPTDLPDLFDDADAFLPSPGVPEAHAAFAERDRQGVRTLSEFDLARWWDDRPVVAVTGTDGKTTVTELTATLLQSSGIAGVPAGNNDLPLIDAIARPDIDVMVVEASSFRLAHTERFSPQAAAWLNFGPDHLDVHSSLESYERAKAKIWAHLPDDGVAVANLDDPVVMAHEPSDRRVVTVGGEGAHARLEGNRLMLGSRAVAELGDLRRAHPHDVQNALTAAVLADEVGATADGLREGLRRQELLAHRLQEVATIDGVRFVNDSKATVPHAVATALGAFESSVLIAGGRNKGLDLRPIAERSDRVRAVVATGESAREIIEAFEGRRPTAVAESMADAVQMARDLAQPGDVVLLSPGCASYDQYSSYQARGDDFIRAVTALAEEASP